MAQVERVDGFVTPDGVRLRVADDPGDHTGDLAVDVVGRVVPTLLLVHGWSQDLRTWDRVVAELRRGGWPGRIVRYDHRGHGGSDAAPRGTATIGRAADDLAALVTDRVPTGPVVLTGHSMGGMTIMALAERHPELFAERVAGAAFVATTSGDMTDLDLGLPGRRGRLVARGEHVLIPLTARLGHRAPAGTAGTAGTGPRPDLDPDPGSSEGHPRSALPSEGALRSGRAPRLRSAAIAPGVRALVFGRHARRADVLSVAEQALAAHPPSVAAFRASIGEHQRTGALERLRGVPVTVLVGDHDRLCPRRHTEVIADALPAATVALFPGAGHMITFERSAEVAAHLRGLLNRAATDASSAPRTETQHADREPHRASA